MRLVISLGGAEVEISEVGSAGEFPYLLEVASLRIAARAGYLSGLGVGESPSLAVTLDNAGRRAATLIGSPIRASATVYDDDGEVCWSGNLGFATFGRNIELTIEA